MRLRQDRWSYHPILTKDGEPLIIEKPTKNDLGKFEFLTPTHYRTLSTPFLARLQGKAVVDTRKRLKELAAEPNCYLELFATGTKHGNVQKRWIGLNGFQWFSLSPRGADALRAQGYEISDLPVPNGREFPHEIGVQASLANIDIGIREAAAGDQMVYPGAIVAHENFAASNDKAPITAKVSLTHTFHNGNKDSLEFTYRPDGFRAIRYANGEWHFFIFEYEHKNRADSTGFRDTSFLMKFLALQLIVEQGLCEDRWGIPRESLHVLVATATPEHLENIRRVVLRETKGKGCDWLGLTVVPTLTQTLSVLPRDLYTIPWQRAGNPDLHLNQLEGANELRQIAGRDERP